MHLVKVIACALVLVGAGIGNVSAATLTVTHGGDAGIGSLRYAITSATAGDEIVFAAPDMTILLTGPLIVDKNLTIRGNNITLYGWGVTRVLELTTGTLTLSDVNIVGGANGVLVETGATLQLSRAVLQNNNTVTTGGGILVEAGASAEIADTTFDTNRSDDFGGAIASFGTLTVTRSTFKDNEARNGGAIAILDGTLTATNNTFFENRAGVDGGAVFVEFGSATLVNNTFAKNVASRGSAAYGNVAANTFSNNIVSENETTSHSGYAVVGMSSTGYNALNGNTDPGGGANDWFSSVATDIIGMPVLQPGGLANNGGFTQTLLPAAAMRCNGDPAKLPAGTTTDQRGAGFPRTAGECLDIGAVQLSTVPPPAAPPSGHAIPTLSGWALLALGGLLALLGLRRHAPAAR